ncbi:NYN domain-containing protein [Brachybacterium sp. J144]|uniref:NYN domain-containing protein n=1 Tax=Brachybacterium sp. J144 TaxID=3116487 RepID=UPI002E786941|nr:NYN domain-containing protein [Brachybacterium sp. J144]MEE1650403.1 NYN domain-containing protein [Brachybacterium sp. J144]
MTQRTTYLLVDGENIDATLGGSVLGRRPQPEERPRWNKLLQHAESAWQQEVKGLFFLAVSDSLPLNFVQALIALGYTPVPLRGEGKVVDIAIQRTAEALVPREADVMLVSHDSDFVPQMEALAEDEERRTAIVGFTEFMSGDLREIPGVELHDLEYDVQAFTSRLPRVRIIEIDEFDPLEFIL